MRMRPAWRSSLIWCETVEGTIPRSSPSSPTQAHPSAPVMGLMLVIVPGWQQEIRRMKIFSRFGLESALNISANLSIFSSRLFDISRNIIPGSIPVKYFYGKKLKKHKNLCGEPFLIQLFSAIRILWLRSKKNFSEIKTWSANRAYLKQVTVFPWPLCFVCVMKYS